MFDSLLQGAALGLATGTACLASCGPVYCTYLLAEKRNGLKSLWVVLSLNAGRFASYAAFGAVIGLLGGVIPPGFRAPLAAGGYILFSAYLLLSTIRVSKSCAGGCGTSKFLRITRSPFLLGILTGFSICPAFLIAMTGAFESSGMMSGMLLFVGFFAGTTVYMLPFAILGLLTKRNWFTTVARILSIFVAVYFLVTGIRMGVRALSGGTAAGGAAGQAGGEGVIYTPAAEDTLWVLGFDGFAGDRSSELAGWLDSALDPHIELVRSDSGSLPDLAGIPRLSAVIAPWWVDPRSGETLIGWQQAFADSLLARRYRVMAVEYEPWCTDRASAISGFLERYSFRVEPDSGFSFLMLNSLECAPTDCDTCPLYE